MKTLTGLIVYRLRESESHWMHLWDVFFNAEIHKYIQINLIWPTKHNSNAFWGWFYSKKIYFSIFLTFIFKLGQNKLTSFKGLKSYNFVKITKVLPFLRTKTGSNCHSETTMLESIHNSLFWIRKTSALKLTMVSLFIGIYFKKTMIDLNLTLINSIHILSVFFLWCFGQFFFSF